MRRNVANWANNVLSDPTNFQIASGAAGALLGGGMGGAAGYFSGSRTGEEGEAGRRAAIWGGVGALGGMTTGLGSTLNSRRATPPFI